MLYQEYHKIKNRYIVALARYDDLVKIKFVNDGFVNNEELDETIKKAKEMVNELGDMAKIKEEELRLSKIKEDKAYVYKYLDGKRASWISKFIGYSPTQTYRILDSIKKGIEELG